MHVIQKGNGFIAEVTCPHCKAVLGCSREDMRYYEESSTGYGPGTEVSIFCPECKSEVSLPRKQWPKNYSELRKWSKLWSKTGQDSGDNGPK